MTEQTPPPPPPPPGPPTPPPGASTPPPPPPPPPEDPTPGTTSRGNGKKLIIGGVAAALVLGGGFGAYAVYDKLDGGGAQPHDVMPASTQAYARIDLDPSAGQKVQLFKLIRKFPDLADEIGIKNEGQDLRELFVDELIAPECDDVDFEKDVEPWLGERIGVGGNIADEKFVVAVQVTDEKKSREGIKTLFDCSDDEYGIAFLDGYAILAPTQKDVDESIKATEKGTLGEKKEFVEAFDDLGEQGIVSAWADGKAILESPEVKAEVEKADTGLGDLDKIGSFATALRVDGSALEIAMVGEVDDDMYGGGEASDLAKLPAGTVAALSIPGLGDVVSDQFDTLLEELDSGFGSATSGQFGSDDFSGDDFSGDDFSGDDFGGDDGKSMLEQFEESTGLDAQEDLDTLLGDGLTMAIGGSNLENLPQFAGPEDLAKLEVALALHSDPAKALDLVKRLADLAGEAGIPLTTSGNDDGAVLATNQDYADAVAGGDGKLGDDKVFRSVIADGETELGGLFVNIGAIVDKLRKADPPPEVEEVLDQIKPLSAIAFSGSKLDDDKIKVSYRLALRD